MTSGDLPAKTNITIASNLFVDLWFLPGRVSCRFLGSFFQVSLRSQLLYKNCEAKDVYAHLGVTKRFLFECSMSKNGMDKEGGGSVMQLEV